MLLIFCLNQVAELKEATYSKDKVWTTSSAERDWKPESPRPEDASVADLVKEVAEEVLAQQTDYIYDEKTGLYYDQNSGYYYDPVSWTNFLKFYELCRW